MSDDDATALIAGAYRKISLRVLPLVVISYVAAYLDRVNVGFAKAQMQADLGISDAVYGLAAGIFFIGYFAFEIPGNIMLQCVGASRWLGSIMLVWARVSALTAFVTGATQFYVMRFLLGAAEAGFSPGVTFYLSGWYTARRWGRAYGWYIVGIPLAGVLGGPLSGAIIHAFDGVLGISGWRWLFLLETLPSI